MYFERKAAAMNAAAQPAVANVNNGGGVPQACLPIITLPNFDGTYEKWQGFHDMFVAMVDRNVALDTVTKFHYLQSALTGKAREYINSFEITEENYPIVLDLLKKRYHNSRLIINHHVHQLFNLPMVTRDSAVSLRALADGLQKHTRILEQLKEPVDKWDTLLLYLASKRLDNLTKKDWELKIVSEKLSKLSEFIEFLENRCQMLEAIAPHGNDSSGFNSKTVHYQGQRRDNRTLTHLAAGDPSVACTICNQNHRIYSCSAFLDLSIDERRDKVKELGLCFNCLGLRHTAKECKSSRFCRHCNSAHHSLLHKGNKPISNSNYQVERKNEKANNRDAKESTGESFFLNMFSYKATTEKLLSTAEIYVRDNVGQLIKARALLDNGSMANFMTKNLCKKLRLKEQKVHHTVSGINLTQTNIMTCASTTIASTQNDYKVKAEFFVTENISQCIPTRKIDINVLSIPDHVTLADPEFHNPHPIDLLLGTAIFWDSMEPTQIRQGQGHPILQLTKFGWILGGHLMYPDANRQNQLTSLFCGLVTNEALNDQMKLFWTINGDLKKQHQSAEEQKCEQVFSETWKRTADGRFEVDLLMKEDCKELGDSFANAEKRLLATERRFQSNPVMKQRYHENLDDFLQLGHMSLHPDQKPEGKNILPHHGVVKESSTTTKLRVVWDGSCKTTTGVSLNDCLMKGPVVQRDLFSIIIRFRQHRFVVTGDIVKMYRQIWIRPEQRNLQCILWRKDPTQPMMIYQLNTVTFGITSSPYLATRCLVQLAEECRESNPVASRVIKEDFYVDDALTGGDTEEEIDTITEDVTEILKGAGFELQKIHTNKVQHNDENEGLDITEIKTLGLRWQPGTDCLRYQSSYEPTKGPLTKRVILSAVAQVFDPLGLIGPFVLRSKLILQHLWKLKIGWDVPIPSNMSEKWSSHCNQLGKIGCIKIPRHALLISLQGVEIHGFCDASQDAYGACIYLRSAHADGSVLVRLLTARSRVSPIKTVSLPRLELCGAVLLTELYSKVRDSLTIKIEDVGFWSDSTVALAWIKGDPSRWQTFVGNRVSEIQKVASPEKWNQVRTDQNPADLISRGQAWRNWKVRCFGGTGLRG